MGGGGGGGWVVGSRGEVGAKPGQTYRQKITARACPGDFSPAILYISSPCRRIRSTSFLCGTIAFGSAYCL